MSTEKEYKFDVAISFAGEDRAIAEIISLFIKPFGVSVFYDNDELHNLWGSSLSEELISIYSEHSKYCLMIVSKDYIRKEWTNHERRAAVTRAIREDGVYILPYVLDETSIEALKGIHSDTHYITRGQKAPMELATVLLNKLLPDQDISVAPSKLIHLVDACDFVLSTLQNPLFDSGFTFPNMSFITEEFRHLSSSTESFNVEYYFQLGSNLLAEANIIEIMPREIVKFTEHGQKWAIGQKAGERRRILADWLKGDAFIG